MPAYPIAAPAILPQRPRCRCSTTIPQCAVCQAWARQHRQPVLTHRPVFTTQPRSRLWGLLQGQTRWRTVADLQAQYPQVRHVKHTLLTLWRKGYLERREVQGVVQYRVLPKEEP